MTKILLISGRKGAGKDTTAKYIIENNDKFFIKKYAFADALKQTVSNLFDIPLADLHNGIKKEELSYLKWENMPHWECCDDSHELWSKFGYDKKPIGEMKNREILQYFGTEICRKMYCNVWENLLLKEIKNDRQEIAIIADVRFPSEIEVWRENKIIQDLFGSEEDKWIEDIKTLRLMRKSDSPCKHSSEISLDNYSFDAVIADGPIDYVNDSINYYLKKWGWL